MLIAEHESSRESEVLVRANTWSGIMRIISALIVTTWAAAASAAESRPIDLDVPGVIEQLKQDRPKHYSAIVEVLQVAERVPCQHRELEIVSARYDIRDLSCTPVLLTSNPPKRRVQFALEGISYVAIVTLTNASAEFVPAKKKQ
jgi:hypothetical protein